MHSKTIHFICLIFPTIAVLRGPQIQMSEAPYQVAITRGQQKQLICGGSILTKNLILTAAHPFDGLNFDDILLTVNVRAGSNKFYMFGQHSHSQFMFRHPKYNSSNLIAPYDYDIAIIGLDVSLDLNLDIDTDMIRLPPPMNVEIGLPVNVTGWGNMYNEDFKLSRINIEILDPEQCKNIYGDQFTERMLCAGDKDSLKHVCPYDVGGPMVLQGTHLQLGVVSFGINCEQLKNPTVFINMADPEIRAFVDDIVDYDRYQILIPNEAEKKKL